MANRFPATCEHCNGHVPAKAGKLRREGRRWIVAHLDCDDTSAYSGDANPRNVSNVIRTSGGTFYRNKQGRCEDAPCCGCCTI